MTIPSIKNSFYKRANEEIGKPLFKIRQRWIIRKLEQENTRLGGLFFNRYPRFPVFRGDTRSERTTGMRPHWLRYSNYTPIPRFCPTPTIYGTEGLVPTSVSPVIAGSFAGSNGHIYGVALKSEKSIVVATRSLMFPWEREISTTHIDPEEYIFIASLSNSKICSFKRGAASLEVLPRTKEMMRFLQYISQNPQLTDPERQEARALLDAWEKASPERPIRASRLIMWEYTKTGSTALINKIQTIAKIIFEKK